MRTLGSVLYRGTADRKREAIVLAGGFGTRLAHVVPDVCKPMAPVAGEPFLRHVLDLLDRAGFARVIIADGYRREQIETYFFGTYRGIEIDYSSEESPLLTGGAVKRALESCSQSTVFIINGDTWFDVDFDAMESSLAKHSNAACCIATKHMFNFNRYGTIEISGNGQIRSFREKEQCDDGLINGGVYLIRKNALEKEPAVFSLENDWFQKVVYDGVLVSCLIEGGFIDIGVPEDYALAQDFFLGLGEKCKLALFDRDGTINVDVGHLHCIENCTFIDSTLDEMRRYSNDPEWRIAVVTNQAGIAKGIYSTIDMRQLHRWMANKLRDKDITVDGWYYCPHHPDYTGLCDCRKPAPGLLNRAMRDFRADSTQCVMFGDSEKDMQAAAAAHIKFEQVRS